ncbi:hypothetical protein BDF14DRAFT_355365 [Spinellus fusiger]|nr:hypothetical protein BDF14DRAFT_355365 [Spinellus fusiger]
MNTPPLERIVPTASQSIPLVSSPSITRPRRHTITRPESALGLLSDYGDSQEEEDQQKTFDRISDILSTLIEEANEAVHGNENTSSKLLKMHSASCSKLPRPKRIRTPSLHTRDPPACSLPLSPISPPSTAPSPPIIIAQTRRNSRSMTARPLSYPALVVRRSATPRSVKRAPMLVQNPLAESFKRLDSSMALVDSLSRDLASSSSSSSSSASSSSSEISHPSTHTHSTSDTHLAGLLLLPLLHIPHALISMVFDSLPSTHSAFQPPASTSSLTSMITWAICFVFANVMVDHLVPQPTTPLPSLSLRTRRLSLPGTFQQPVTLPRLLPTYKEEDNVQTTQQERQRRKRPSRRHHKKNNSIHSTPFLSPPIHYQPLAIRRTRPQASWSPVEQPRPCLTRRCSI